MPNKKVVEGCKKGGTNCNGCKHARTEPILCINCDDKRIPKNGKCPSCDKPLCLHQKGSIKDRSERLILSA